MKIHEIFCENPRIIFVLSYDVHKENMFTINLEDEREAAFKANIYTFGWSVCLFVCLYPINVKTAELIGPKFFVGSRVTPGNVYEWSKFQIFLSIKIRFSSNFWKFRKYTRCLVKIRELFFSFVLRCTQREHVHN